MPQGYPKALEEYNLSELLTVRQLAEEIFHIHPNTMYRWTQQYKIPHIRIGNRIFFRQEAIQEWMRANEKGVLKDLDPADREQTPGS